MNVKSLVRQKIMNEVLRSNEIGTHWRNLVVDRLSLKMVSSCFTIYEINAEKITIEDLLDRSREPHPSLEAVYLLSPTNDSVESLISDITYPWRKKYKAAHVFFTRACPDELFNKIVEVVKCLKLSNFLETLKEINIDCIPYESQVFSLDFPDGFQCYYNRNKASQRTAAMERMAEQIATLCSTLGEYPAVRYRADDERNIEFAQMVQHKLDRYKADDPAIGDGHEKSLSQLLIIDRGVDGVSPLLHELTLQAMAYDLLPIENNVYKYLDSGVEKHFILDEHNELWKKHRHLHIAVVSKNIRKNIDAVAEYASRLKELADGLSSGEPSLTPDEYSDMMKLMQSPKEASRLGSLHVLVQNCIKKCHSEVRRLIDVEQDLAMNVDAKGVKVKNPFLLVETLLLEDNVSPMNKIRMILLYLLSKNGISREFPTKLIQHAGIPDPERPIITNMTNLGFCLINEGDRRKQRCPNSDERTTRRWTPIIKDIMEDAIDDKLDREHFPYLVERSASIGDRKNTTSVRVGCKDRSQQIKKNAPRLIVFIVGGATFSEIRCAYEVMKARHTCEVIID
ncbi:hypothetical protein QYM36_018612 [Artemia franciscana]|uniref:Uncharacterized protein n=1 Tax=Artemia franciscana TaxID=6661 RepID=A0AA88KRE8_ARTSF|nr:hypothetical protein QYM36_018612 [Artemia franciscana]